MLVRSFLESLEMPGLEEMKQDRRGHSVVVSPEGVVKVVDPDDCELELTGLLVDVGSHVQEDRRLLLGEQDVDFDSLNLVEREEEGRIKVRWRDAFDLLLDGAETAEKL